MSPGLGSQLDVHSSVGDINGGGLVSADLMENSPLMSAKETTVISLDYVNIKLHTSSL